MDCGLFGVRFLFLGHKNGAAAPVDYLSTFATAPFNIVFYYFIIFLDFIQLPIMTNYVRFFVQNYPFTAPSIAPAFWNFSKIR